MQVRCDGLLSVYWYSQWVHCIGNSVVMQSSLFPAE